LVSFKGEIGHTLGASGPAELALLLDALERGVVPPTKGFSRVDPELGLEPKGGDGRSVRRVLFTLAGFGCPVTSPALHRRRSSPPLSSRSRCVRSPVASGAAPERSRRSACSARSRAWKRQHVRPR